MGEKTSRIGSESEAMSGHDRETTPSPGSRGRASASVSDKREAVTRLLRLSRATRAGRGTATWTRDELHER